jgi:hypothetical protein
MAESVSVDFVRIGNRQGLTDEQLVEHPHLERFFLRFRHCFERDPLACVWLFIEPDDD